MAATAWSTQQLAEFVAAVSAAESEAAAALTAVERAVEELDADVGAIVSGGEVVAAVGYPRGRAPAADLGAVEPGVDGSSLEVPGVGTCIATAAWLEHPPGATLVVARPDPLAREESGLLRAMARVASMTMRMLRVLDDQRAAREEIERLAREQAALRRVATLVARSASPAAVLAAVAREVGRLLSVDHAYVTRFDADDSVTVLAGWIATTEEAPAELPRRVPVGPMSALLRKTGRPARLDPYPGDPGAGVLEAGVRSAVSAPITVERRLWGFITAASTNAEPPPADTEERLANFTELVATAIANAEAYAELTASRARIIATADETRRRIERDLHDGAQQQLASLVLQLRAAQADVPPDREELAADLDRVAIGLTMALDELREYARGIHPAVLAEGGLGRALKTLARRSAVPVDLDVRIDGRLPEAVEVGAYYVVSEALTNAAKHANASVITVGVEPVRDVLRLSVRDDGVGGAAFERGSGLVGLKDRVEALHGSISIASPPGAGTSIEVELPVIADGAAPMASR